MFPGMMDPEMIRMAQEQMSRMSPADLARIQQQMMSNPDLLRMASESMKNLRPEDLKQAAEQMKYTRPEDVAEIGERMAKASPEEIASMRAQMDAQVTYQLNGAEMLKKQGNELHSQGRYKDALQKYLRAKQNLKDIPASKAQKLVQACSLNMMSCYLKTSQYDECIKEGTEVLAYDPKNIKALYRRGQAYKELGCLEEAVSDLSRAHEVSPEDETIADILRDAKERLGSESNERPTRGVVIEEISEETTEETTVSTGNHQNLTSEEDTRRCSTSEVQNHREAPTTNADYLNNLRDPEAIRSFQNFISRTDPETLSAISGGRPEGISPETVKTASNLIGKMSPEELQRMFQVASSFQGENGFPKGGPSPGPGSIQDMSPEMLKIASDMMGKMSPDDLQKMFQMATSVKGKETLPSQGDSPFPGSVPPGATPEMFKMATDMMNKMSPEERQKMFEFATSFRGQESALSSAGLNSNGLRSDVQSRTRDMSRANGNDAAPNMFVQGLDSTGAQSSLLNSSPDLQEQLRNQMKDPAMRQMMTSMMKNMSPDMMANMSEQFGFKLSREDAEKAHQAMSSLSPDALDTMMRWADRIQRGIEGARKTKNWLLGKPGMMLAIFMLLLAFILQWFGFIGR